jgi:hypothetical protein
VVKFCKIKSGANSNERLDIFDALGIKDVYAPKRKQGESKH